MKISLLYNKSDLKRRTKEKILHESYISFTEAADRQGIKYKRDYNGLMQDMIIHEFPFEPEYWMQYPEKKNMDFVEGATLPIFKSFDHEFFQNKLQYLKEKIPLIKNEISQSTWEKITPLK